MAVPVLSNLHAQTQELSLLRIVVASPSDVAEERAIVDSVAAKINGSIGQTMGLALRVSRWETDAYPGFDVGGPQGLIDRILRIPECDLFVGLFWKRFGTPTQDTGSGTEHEFQRAYESWRLRGTPAIMFYFKRAAFEDSSSEEYLQAARVARFKEQFPTEGLWWRFETAEQFAQLLEQHITNYLADCQNRLHIAKTSAQVGPGARLASKTIDRGPQADEFRAGYFTVSEANIYTPQLFVLWGHVLEDHGGLIERLVQMFVSLTWVAA